MEGRKEKETETETGEGKSRKRGISGGGKKRYDQGGK